MTSAPTSGTAAAARRGWRLRAAGESTGEFWLLLGCTLALTALGLVMTFSSSFVQATSEHGEAFYFVRRQLIAGALGLPVLVLLALGDYRVFRRLALPILGISLVLATLVLVPGLGVEAGGAQRWFRMGPLSLQPSELLKLAVPLAVSAVLAARWTALRGGDLHALLWPTGGFIGAAAAVTMAGPDLETAALLVVTGGLCLYAAGLPLRIVGVIGGVTGVLGLFFIVSTPFRRARITAWLDPMEHAGEFGYQTVQGLIALGSGGVLGRGLGQGRGQWLYIPNAHTDFIYAIIGEELGLLGAMTVLLLFLGIAIGGFRTARRAADPFGRLVATGITGWLLLQAAMNMGSVVGLLPVTGVTLPLISFGGTSLMVTMAALGILLSIARHTRRQEEVAA
jgi:cell division protein FtsW